MPSFNGGDDFGGICSPGEWLRLFVVLGDEAVDRCRELHDRVEHAAFEPTLGEHGEEAFEGVEPRARCRGEMEREAGEAIEPLANFGMFVRGVIVEDHISSLVARHIGIAFRKRINS